MDVAGDGCRVLVQISTLDIAVVITKSKWWGLLILLYFVIKYMRYASKLDGKVTADMARSLYGRR